MTIRYLLDENLSPKWRKALVRLDPGLEVLRIGDPTAPPHEAPDPVILNWCEANACILVTDNRTTMPVHLAEHLAKGQHVPGIFLVSNERNVRQTLRDLVLIAGASFENEWLDQIVYLPIT